MVSKSGQTLVCVSGQASVGLMAFSGQKWAGDSGRATVGSSWWLSVSGQWEGVRGTYWPTGSISMSYDIFSFIFQDKKPQGEINQGDVLLWKILQEICGFVRSSRNALSNIKRF